MHFELEKIDAEEVYICRGYKDNKSDYFVSSIVKRNPDGLYEPCAWVSKAGGFKYHKEGIKFLVDHGWGIAFTFEKAKLAAYQRMLKGVGILKVLKEYTHTYNNIDIEFCYGKVEPDGNS